MRTILNKLTILIILFIYVLPFNSAVLLSQESWKASPELVKKLSLNQTEINYYEEKVPAFALPPLLITAAGKEVNRSQEWLSIMRPHILNLFESQVFGKIPDTQYKKEFKLVKEDKKAINGAATLKEVDIIISAGGKSITIHLGLFIPNNVPKPVPAFLLICNRPANNIDFTRNTKSEFWPVEEILARGYAAAAFYNADVDPDTYDEFKDGIHGLLDKSRDNESWGTIAAWAWGASRCVDYLVTDNAIAKDKFALVGHSRGGKAALWAGAMDERIALVIPNEAGCGGTALERRKYGETIDRITKTFPHWFCGNYKYYSNREDSLPVDNHMLLALIAPRALYVASADQDLWADPRGEYLSLFYSIPVYRLFKPDMQLPYEMPPLNMPVVNGQVAYHIRKGEHNLLLLDWNYFMDFADKIFNK